MNAPIDSQEIRFLLTDTDAARRGASIAADARRQAKPSPLLRAAQSVLAWLKTWPTRRTAMRELSGLTDRELADIGLSRHEIRQIFSRH